MIFNFTAQSLTIVCIFLGMGLFTFLISLPYLCSKEVLREDEVKNNSPGGDAK